MHIVYNKNVETISRKFQNNITLFKQLYIVYIGLYTVNFLGLKEEMLNSSQNVLNLNEHPFFLDSDNSFFGFDSVIVSRSVFYIDY